MIKWLIPIVLLWSCDQSPETQRLIDEHYQAVGDPSFIQNIITRADCVSPDGKYQTETQSSTKDNYLLFLQRYDFKPNPLYALILDWHKGQGLDTALVPQGALSNAVIAVLKAHEFHEMMLQVDSRFGQMTLLEDTTFFGQKCSQVITSDQLGLPVRVFFDKTTHLMAGFSEVNPYKKGEVIRVHFDDWVEQDGIKIFKKLQITQGKANDYTFDYKQVIFNDPSFKKIALDKK